MKRCESLRSDDDLKLFYKTAERVYIRDAGDRSEQRTHNVILDRTQFRRVILGVLADEDVLKDLSQTSGDRTKLDIHTGGQVLACTSQPLGNKLAREVVIHAVFE